MVFLARNKFYTNLMTIVHGYDNTSYIMMVMKENFNIMSRPSKVNSS